MDAVAESGGNPVNIKIIFGSVKPDMRSTFFICGKYVGK